MKNKFIISDSVFFSNKKEKALFYDVLTHAYLVIDKGNPSVNDFLDSLTLQNLFTTSFEEKQNDDVNAIINCLVENKLGRVVPENKKDCSIPLVPILNDDLAFESDLNKKTENVIQRDVMRYLDQVTFYLGGSSICDNNLNRQISYPIASSESLSFSKIVSFIDQCNRRGGQCLFEIVISDPTDARLLQFAEEMKSQRNQVSFVMLSTEQNASSARQLLSLGYQVVLLLDSTLDTHVITGLSAKYRIVIRGDEDLSLFERLKDSKIEIQPELVFDNNLAFLKDHVFIDTSDFEQIKCSKRELFIHQKINLSFWGRLFVSPDGAVYASPMRISKLGKISDSVLEIISKELIENTAWRIVRDAPCCEECVYQWLCPSPNALEHMISPRVICKRA